MASDAAPIQPGVDSTAQQIPPRSYPTFSSKRNAAYSVTSSCGWRQALSTAAGIVITIVIVVVVAVVVRNASKGNTFINQPSSPTLAPAGPSGPAPQVCEGPPPSNPGVSILDTLLGASGQSTPESKSRAASWNPTVLSPRRASPTTGSIKKALMFRFNAEFDPVLLATLKRVGAKKGGRKLLNVTTEASPKDLFDTVTGLNARNGFMPPQSLGLMLNSTLPGIAKLVRQWYYSSYARIYILHLKNDVMADQLYASMTSLPTGQMDFIEFSTGIAASASAQPVPPPNDPNYPYQWALQKIGLLTHTGAPPAWSVTQGSPQIIVAVMDSGVDYTHPDLVANMWTNTAEAAGDAAGNDLDDDGNGYSDDVHGFNFVKGDPDPMDDDGHGTHCAGIIAAEAYNKVGIAGVAPNVKIMALKVLDAKGEGRIDYQVQAMDYLLRMGAHISSNSYGGPASSRALDAMMQKLEAAGVLVVAAAGNERTNLDVTPSFPAASGFKNIVSVGASDQQDCIANYSNYGKNHVDLVAPGTLIVSTVPTALYRDGYLLMSGTSMATPHVAAAAALLLSVRSDNGKSIDGQAELLKQVLLQSTAKGAAFEGYVATGGRLDVANAVAMVVGARR